MATVLIVSSDSGTAELAAFMCRTAGHGVALVDNGLQAIMLLDERHFDVILADLGAARFCAHALARLVRSAAMPDSRPAIVAMAERQEPVGAIGDLGIAAVVTKPLQPDVFRQAMLTALGHGAWVEITPALRPVLDLE